MPALSVEEIRARMARIRVQAHGKASRLGAEGRQFLDWKHYVKLYPWATIAIAAAAGYWLVPRLLQMAQPVVEPHPETSRTDSTGIAPQTEARRRPGLLSTVFGNIGEALFRAGIAYAGQQVGRMMAESNSLDEIQRNHRHEQAQSVA